MKGSELIHLFTFEITTLELFVCLIKALKKDSNGEQTSPSSHHTTPLNSSSGGGGGDHFQINHSNIKNTSISTSQLKKPRNFTTTTTTAKSVADESLFLSNSNYSQYQPNQHHHHLSPTSILKKTLNFNRSKVTFDSNTASSSSSSSSNSSSSSSQENHNNNYEQPARHHHHHHLPHDGSPPPPPPLPRHSIDSLTTTTTTNSAPSNKQIAASASALSYTIPASLANFSHFDVRSLHFNYESVKATMRRLHFKVNNRTGASAAVSRVNSAENIDSDDTGGGGGVCSVTLPVIDDAE
jgi:hypothetical protein